MQIKIDENLPRRAAELLRELGHDVQTVAQEDLTGAEDHRVWQAAQQEQRLLITQDLDFSDMRDYRPGEHAGLLLLRLKLPGRNALLAAIERLFRTENVASWGRCLVIASETKLRVVRPET
ncbi:MAG: DUF5615 family PIN-like protein [Planctomycetota bacterium]